MQDHEPRPFARIWTSVIHVGGWIPSHSCAESVCDRIWGTQSCSSCRVARKKTSSSIAMTAFSPSIALPMRPSPWFRAGLRERVRQRRLIGRQDARLLELLTVLSGRFHRFDRQHRTRGRTDRALCNTSDQNVSQACIAACAHHDQVAADFLGHLGNHE